jgi:hypothetical protein
LFISQIYTPGSEIIQTKFDGLVKSLLPRREGFWRIHLPAFAGSSNFNRFFFLPAKGPFVILKKEWAMEFMENSGAGEGAFQNREGQI